jgi:hypothetical protein
MAGRATPGLPTPRQKKAIARLSSERHQRFTARVIK